MKLSEFKEYIINKFGEKEWEKIESTYEYKIYVAPKEEQLKAVKERGDDIKYIKNPSEELKIEAIKCIHTAIQYIDNPSEELQLLAVKQSYFSLLYLHNPSDEVLKEALKDKNCSIDYMLKHIKNDLKGRRKRENETR